MTAFSSVLVANRGEIALRIIRTARMLGYRTVAIASEADRNAPHAKAADETVVIGPPPVGQSYLDAERILAAARSSGAEAVHPGYGFLSENAGFARRVREEGLIFVGPSPEAIELMGDKARAKRAMIEAGVPCIPGYEGEDQADDRFIAAAEDAGYPVMVKAAAGGGGRGMRMVRERGALAAALRDARSEAENAFGSGTLILEKAVENARHVEVQVFGDRHGHVIHLGERDCSLQRRHQKVIEEAPSPAVDEELRARMGEAAVRAARAVDYEGAGTVEFLLADDGSFYFLEMNTRLQVEHPVTEEVTGLDLVALQFKVAQGEPLGLGQDDIRLRGHAIEARLYAEDPASGFLPSTGLVLLWSPPRIGRTDAGIETGGEVSPHYDPMLAKIIARGETRADAIRLLARALEETALLGVKTNRRFLLDLVRSQTFRGGEARTTTIDRDPPIARADPDIDTLALAAAIRFRMDQDKALRLAPQPEELLGWSSSETLVVPYSFAVGEEPVSVTVTQRRGGLDVGVGDETRRITIDLDGESGTGTIDNQSTVFFAIAEGNTLHIAGPDGDISLTEVSRNRKYGGDAQAVGAVTASMHGLLTEVLVSEGDSVAKGQRIATLEAMKMQHEVTAPIAGIVSELRATAGNQVASGDLLVHIEPEKECTE